MSKSDHYKKDGDKIERTNPHCPKCGKGTLMADHEDRYHCGNCGYTKYKEKD